VLRRRDNGGSARSSLASAGGGTRCGDVGVRFGGSEHHRIGLAACVAGATSSEVEHRTPWLRLGTVTEGWLRLVGRTDSASNGKKATGRSDAVPAVDEGKSLKGVSRVTGSAAGRLLPSGGVWSERARNVANPRLAAGCNRPAN
jgi:hypothetical protein